MSTTPVVAEIFGRSILHQTINVTGRALLKFGRASEVFLMPLLKLQSVASGPVNPDELAPRWGNGSRAAGKSNRAGARGCGKESGDRLCFTPCLAVLVGL